MSGTVARMIKSRNKFVTLSTKEYPVIVESIKLASKKSCKLLTIYFIEKANA